MIIDLSGPYPATKYCNPVRRLLLILLASACLPAVAEDAIDEIQVTATRRPVRVNEVPSALTSIQANSVQANKLVTDALSAEPGVFLQQTTPGQGAVIIRGLKGSAILHLVDGVRLNNAIFRSAPTQYFALVPPGAVERIEVVRGSPTSLYGSDAVGGVVQLVTRVPGFDTSETDFRGDAYVAFDTAELGQTYRGTLDFGNKNYSSWSLRPWLSLKYAGAAFEEVVIGLRHPDTREKIMSYSKAGKVPILRHGEITVWDSLAICEYVAELFPAAGLWPTDSQARAVARSVCAEMHSGFSEIRNQMPMNIRADKSHLNLANGPDIAGEIHRVTSLWEECRAKYGSRGDFLFGGFTNADAMFAPVVSRFKTYGVTVSPTVQAYIKAVWELPEMRQWIEQARAEPMAIDAIDDL